MSSVTERPDHDSLPDDSSGGSEVERDPVEELAAEFSDRLRNGERVSIEQYASQHPEVAAEIRELFPTIVAMEQLNTQRLMERVPSGPVPRQFGDYRIIGEIARGGMGIVYEAEQVSLGRRVAVKVLPSHALRREKDVRRFERESQTAANLHHSNIVPVFGVGEENGQRYIVMQLIRGVGLDEVLREIKHEVVEAAGASETRVTTSRITIAKRSAAGLLESELKLNSTSVDANAETVETELLPSEQPPQEIRPVVIHTSMGHEYYKNVARVGLQVAEALQYAHNNNTLHRDIKPGNLLLDDDGRVWIADFGLAKAVEGDDVTCSGDIVGTMAYVAPERFRGTTTKASDIYSLGVTLHEMLTLQKAFDGEDRVAVMNLVTNQRLPNSRSINKAVPRDLETIVLKAASQDPKDRYESAAKLAKDLEAFLELRPIEARPLSQVEHGLRWCRRNRGMAAMAGAMLLLLASVIGILTFGYKHADEERQRAERVSKAAVGALDEIYNRFALTPLTTSLGEEDVDTEVQSIAAPQMPISKDVALLLGNLLEFYDELSNQIEGSEEVTLKYIGANRRVGDINRRLGQREDARSSYEVAVERIEQLSPTLRDTTNMRLETARVYNGMGLTFQYDFRHSTDRVKCHSDAVRILDHANPTDEESFELATSLYLLHGAERHRNWGHDKHRKSHGENKAEAPHLVRASNILGKLKNKNPKQADYDLLIAQCLLAEHKAGGGTREDQQQAIAILEGLIERFPENPDYQSELGNLYVSNERKIAWQRHRKGLDSDSLSKSEANLRKGLEATANLEVRHPNIPQYYLLKKLLHEYLGEVLRKQNQHAEAESQFDQSMQMQQMLINSDEHPEIHRPYLYELQVRYGKLLRDSGQLERAKETLLAATLQLESLAAEPSEEPESRFEVRRHRDSARRLGTAYVALASVLAQLDDDEASREMLNKAEGLER